MTEAVFPTLFHQDPRYFRRASGGIWPRLGSAAWQVFRSRSDSGRMQLNFSEIIGSSAGVAISNAYYPDDHSVGSNAAKLCEQVGTDAISQVLKEFWPDVKRRFFHHHDTVSQIP